MKRRKRTEKVKSEANLFVERQLETGDPPEVRPTLERLMGLGFDRELAVQLISLALLSEYYDIVRLGMSFDRNRYIMRMEALPDLSWVDD